MSKPRQKGKVERGTANTLLSQRKADYQAGRAVQDPVSQAEDIALQLEDEGYFDKVYDGDLKAGSLFARLVAYKANLNGDPNDFGWLSKSPGESQVDGYATDAIVLGNNPSNRNNAYDMINSVGVPGATLAVPFGGPNPRREGNKWVKPVPLTQAEMDYLKSGTGNGDPCADCPPPCPDPSRHDKPDCPNPALHSVSYDNTGGDSWGVKVFADMQKDYARAGQNPPDTGIGGWVRRVFWDQMFSKPPMTKEAALEKQRRDLCGRLGIPYEQY